MLRGLAATGVAALLLLPAAAGARTYCAGAPAGVTCDESYPANGAGLQAAIDAADTFVDIGGGGDTVQIDAGFYNDPDGFRTEGGDITIIGRGPADTVLRATDAADVNKTVLKLKPGFSTVATALRGVRAEQVGPSSGAIRDVLNVADVEVTGGPIGGFSPVLVPPGGRLSRAVVRPSALVSTISAVNANDGTIEDTFIRLVPNSGATNVYGVSTGGTANLRHVTIAGDGSAPPVGVLVSGVGAPATATIRDTTITGVGSPLRRFASGVGSAAINYRYTWLDPAKPFITQGTGSITPGPGNPAGDPKLNSGGIPQAGSVLIDRGDPAGPEAGDSATDVRGGARIQNGRRDIGAYETRPGTATQPPPGGGSAADRTRPRITRLKLRRRKGRLRISFRLSEAARVKFTFERKGRKKRRTVYRRKGSFTKALKAGANTIVFSGRIGRKRLPQGGYRLTLVATDKARNRSRPARARIKRLFRPVK